MTAIRAVLLSLTTQAQAWVLYPGSGIRDNIKNLTNIQQVIDHYTQIGDVPCDGPILQEGCIPAIFRWGTEHAIRGDLGLRGGLTWAVEPGWCDAMLEVFKEGKDFLEMIELINCDIIKASLTASFQTWQSNNRNIHFLDVTDLCDKDGWETVPGAQCTSKTCQRCKYAEIVIALFDATDEDHAGARVKPQVSPVAPMLTNEVYDGGGAFLEFSFEYANNLCWYIDATFCAMFYHAKYGGIDVVTLMGSILGMCFIISFTLFFIATLRGVKLVLFTMFASWDVDGDGFNKEDIKDLMKQFWKSFRTLICRCKWDGLGGRKIDVMEALDALMLTCSEIQLFRVIVMFFFLCFPPVFYYNVFRPCWDCKDFVSASVHEIGHMLGFDHPNEFEKINFVSNRDQYNCSNPAQGVTMSTDTDLDSVLYAFMTHNPRSCLTSDDLDGLNFLYPVCENRVEEPVCINTASNIGWLRLAQSTFVVEFIPILFFTVLKIVCKCLVTHRRRIARKLRMEVGRMTSAAVIQAEETMHKVKEEAKREQEMLKKQKERMSKGGKGKGKKGQTHPEDDTDDETAKPKKTKTATGTRF